MKSNFDVTDFRYNGKGKLHLEKRPTKLAKRLYRSDADLKARLENFRKEIDDRQQQMFAQDRWSMLLVFQAMDAAGKDGTIRHVMSGINPHGVQVHSFKRPSEEELDHDYLWRTVRCLPPRGCIGLFNRSYYEEVLVVRVHPEIVTGQQRLPAEQTKDLKKLWKRRFREIRHFEEMLESNGTAVAKFYLHVSKDEQKKRFMERIETPSKNWKFNSGDVKERAHWDEYMAAYEEAVSETASEESPWYIVPADDKGDMRLIVGAAIFHEMKKLNLAWPRLAADQKAQLEESKKLLLSEP